MHDFGRLSLSYDLIIQKENSETQQKKTGCISYHVAYI
ncbi:hypothetical protein EBA29_03521 [Bacillus velezensis]|uniref:Uncharacterized protein n=1 Tax=Bacillus amyloliquefaciens (strain Y2) TaxID=1155777 RepID=I2CAZ3_BACAY|nr:hypothetical protein MUS_3964 [Bacillus velezensis YAU B9601-Y2]AGZ58157.1 hypothetical protein U471_34600 [Bacillus amyloliquefaciens CC178]AHC43893.1 hypothetical protein U722_17820 [Bacillus amyloliquefaciens LFB112]AMQ71433.1 hypothetical protein BAMY6639_08690 [Bacillus amyloliquefaciens UMAF6639]AMQ72017.1 hypothetical protein BAMY6614_01130 [Bacillus amyloliquefaciens UMAF6614]ANF38386.1 hypothetical protein BCBMB205_35000 [Bacillus velezensis]ERH54805.1 hypothetical protein O205_11